MIELEFIDAVVGARTVATVQVEEKLGVRSIRALFPFPEQLRTAKRAAVGLLFAGLFWSGYVRAQIIVQDGSTNAITKNNFPTAITNTFTVTPGASVMVVETYVQNNLPSDQAPTLSNWGSQSFTRVGGEYNARSVYASSDIFYLTNPAPGTHRIIATNTPGGTVTAMAMQVYTLNGVDTSVAPSFFHTNKAYGTTNSVIISGVPAGAWAAFSFSWGYNGSGNTVSTTSGVLGYGQVFNNLTNYIGQAVLMGGVANLGAGSTTLQVANPGGGGVQSALAVAVFAAAAYTPPPTNVIATGQLNQVALTWNDASGGMATNYIILRSTVNGSGYTAIGTNTSNALTTFTDINVVNYTTYYYEVEAVGPFGTSRASAVVSANALGVPPAPTGLMATPLNAQVGLIWNPQPGATGYRVRRATGSPTSFTTIASPSGAIYADSGLVNGTAYYYEVNATNSYGSSPNSDYVLAVPAFAAAGIALHDGSLNYVRTVGSGVATISTNFVVTQGASVLVVELWDFNYKTDNSSPRFMTWSNATLGLTQTLTRAISQNCQGYNYSDSDLFYLFNPAPGYGVVSGTDTNSSSPGGMTMQVYTLSGVDTNIAPAAYGIGNGSATSLSVATAATTASGSWAAVISYNANTGHPLTNFATSGTSYYFQNSTVNAMGYIADLMAGSSTITAQEDATGGATLMALAAVVFTPVVGLAAPTNPVATAQMNQVALSWNDASGGAATSYIIFRSTSSGSGYTAIATNDGNASVNYTDTNVVSSGTYYYVVQAVGPGGLSPYSAQVSVYLGVLSAPTGLSAAAGDGAVALTWNALPGATSYNVLRATSNPGSQVSYTIIGSPTAASYADTALVNGTTYYYEVDGVNGFGAGARSAYVSAIPGVAVGQPPLTEVRTASPTVLVAFFKDSRWSGPVWQRSYDTNQVNMSNLALWTLNGTPVTAIDAFITEANAVDYHMYLHVPPLVNGTSYTLTTPNGSTNFVFDDTKIFCESIKVNQSGYSALSQKRFANLAVWLGSGGAQPISGPLPPYTVFHQFTGQPVANGTLQAYGGGTQDSSSGDYVYRIDLSGVPEGGPYRVSVSGYGCSYPFGVGGDFSRRLGHVAFRALYYNRCGCPIVQPYAWVNIRPYPCHANIYDSQGPDSETFSSGTVQTSQPRLFVHGGHHDAGDVDRRGYHLLIPPVLMTTYEVFPGLFTDRQFNIPDQFDASYSILGSGNGVPDILDEAMWSVMFWTNVQSTPRGPSGAVAWGSNAAGYPAWGINYDNDTLLWGTETNNVDSSSLAAGIFMHMARLIKPYNAQVSADLQARGDAAYNYATSTWGSSLKNTHKLYFAIQKYLLTGDATANNNIHSLYTSTSAFPGSYNKQTGGFLVDGSIWMASYFVSYILATNNPPYPLDPTVVNYLCKQLQAAADNQVSWTTNAAYPSGWRATDNPAAYNFTQYYFTAEGQIAYPCLLQWALTRQQKYIDTVSLLMDYPQGLNPLGKCYMTGLGFEQTHNPQQTESAYAEWTMGWGGPIPGITVYGPGPVMTAPNLYQIPAVSGLPRERKWMDDCGSYQWTEFTVEESEMFPAVVYPVLAQGGAWSPAREPFLNPAASISAVSNGVALAFGGLPGQPSYVQVSSAITGPWADLSGPLLPDAAGTVHFTAITSPGQAMRFYRARWTAPIY